MKEQYLVELEYQNYCAESELMSVLQEASEFFQSGIILEKDLEVFNEFSMQSITDYLSKLVNDMQQAWNKFRSGFQSEIWDTYYKNNKDYLEGDFEMETPDSGTTVPLIREIQDSVLKAQIPKYEEVNKNILKEEETFISQDTRIKYFYEKGKSITDVVEAKAFHEIKSKITMNAESIKAYVNFLGNYENLSDKVADEIHTLNAAVKIARDAVASAKKAAQEKKDEEAKKETEEKLKQNNTSSSKDSDKDKDTSKSEPDPTKAANTSGGDNKDTQPKGTEGNTQVNTDAYLNFDVSMFLLESFCLLQEDDKDKFTAKDDNSKAAEPANNTEEKSKTEEDTEKYNKELAGINVYFSVCTKILSVKMATVNKARKLAFNIVKNFVRLAKEKDRDAKKAERKAVNAAPTTGKIQA